MNAKASDESELITAVMTATTAAAMFILVKTNMVIVSEDDGDVTAADRNLFMFLGKQRKVSSKHAAADSNASCPSSLRRVFVRGRWEGAYWDLPLFGTKE